VVFTHVSSLLGAEGAITCGAQSWALALDSSVWRMGSCESDKSECHFDVWARWSVTELLGEACHVQRDMFYGGQTATGGYPGQPHVQG
jgi:hypothetical protein